jgi:arabinan endo-1,5-alpha-L-arabinosidase
VAKTKVGLYLGVALGVWIAGQHLLFSYDAVQPGEGVGNELIYRRGHRQGRAACRVDRRQQVLRQHPRPRMGEHVRPVAARKHSQKVVTMMFETCPVIPRIKGPWRPLYTPKQHGNYVNDHTLLRAEDGTWHLFGITGFHSDPAQERYFTHARSERLLTPEGMTEAGKVLDEGGNAWAPCVVEHDGAAHMLYGPSPTRLAVTTDLSSNEWWVQPAELVGAPLFAAHRDHMVIRLNDHTWLMYVSGLYQRMGAISCFVSNNLRQWRFVQYALTSSGNAPLTPAWGAFESPYVVHRDGLYYLFTTYTDCERESYHQTLVFTSTNPYDFGEYTGDNHDAVVLTSLDAHAPEIVQDPEDGSWYITSCGWRNKGTHHEGGVAIASLEWTE